MSERIDTRGMRCPWPAIRLARALRSTDADMVEILADDPAAEREMTAVASAAGWSLERIAENHFHALR
ncbi:sulfurtransferase TusA family protein [Stakelama marina]|uniref:Sulfurtransferase TusA family protein n=1 Tax=Stakelama marina TaxID=2826939 RepID=A0A8T4IGI1_9SPHN|nr:sulfurtransferase TusA family protein [Stakelama marina]MBR0552175.1 sulfurtransferase TusA family protein [Stakelama marina]